jgi:hypothetical protein
MGGEEEKIIINGGIAARVLDEICKSIYNYQERGGTFSDPEKLVLMANKIEDLAFKFTREVLEQMGFEGPWPHSMS